MAASTRKESKQLIILHVSVGVAGLDAKVACQYFDNLHKHFQQDFEIEDHNVKVFVTENRASEKVDITCVYPMNLVITEENSSLIPSTALIESLRKEVEGR